MTAGPAPDGRAESPARGQGRSGAEARDADGLRAWIREHRVCWELSPHVELQQHRRVQVGFDLTLSARHPEGLADGPGCQIGRQHYETLCEIARAAVPEDDQPTRCEFAPFDASVHLRPETRWTPEIELNVAILHRDATFADVDDDERRCAAQIQEELRRLGAQQGTWSSAEARAGSTPI